MRRKEIRCKTCNQVQSSHYNLYSTAKGKCTCKYCTCQRFTPNPTNRKSILKQRLNELIVDLKITNQELENYTKNKLREA